MEQATRRPPEVDSRSSRRVVNCHLSTRRRARVFARDNSHALSLSLSPLVDARLDTALQPRWSGNINPYALDYPVCLADDGTPRLTPAQARLAYATSEAAKRDARGVMPDLAEVHYSVTAWRTRMICLPSLL